MTEKLASRASHFVVLVANACEGVATAKGALLNRVVEAFVASIVDNAETDAKAASKALADAVPALSKGTEAVYRSWTRKAIEPLGEGNLRTTFGDASAMSDEQFNAKVAEVAAGLNVRPADKRRGEVNSGKQSEGAASKATTVTPYDMAGQAVEALVALIRDHDDEQAAQLAEVLAANLAQAVQTLAARKEARAEEAKAKARAAAASKAAATRKANKALALAA